VLFRGRSESTNTSESAANDRRGVSFRLDAVERSPECSPGATMTAGLGPQGRHDATRYMGTGAHNASPRLGATPAFSRGSGAFHTAPNSARRFRRTVPAARRSHFWSAIVPSGREPAMPMATSGSPALRTLDVRLRSRASADSRRYVFLVRRSRSTGDAPTFRISNPFLATGP
jgi:hypothetical protein